MPSPTQKSLALLRAQGYTAEVVERWLPRANVRKDLFGCIDIIAMGGQSNIRGRGIVGIQTTTLSSYQQHVTKLQEKHDLIRKWLESGADFVMHCWGEGSKNGKSYKRLRVSDADVAGKLVVWEEMEYIVKRGYELEPKE